MASRKSIGTSNSKLNTLIHVISVEFNLHSKFLCTQITDHRSMYKEVRNAD